MQLNNNNGEDNSNENNSINRIMDDFMTMLMDTTTQNRELVRDISNMNNRLLSLQENTLTILLNITNTNARSTPTNTDDHTNAAIAAGLESANNVKISQTNTPWKSSQCETLCYRCRYYGHNIFNCPNIKDEYHNACLKCYQDGHYSQNCSNEKVAPPFKDNFNPPHILKQQQQ
ncbi:8585_t:CDS:1 [Entrophospora sp. SA101]|nr:8585_t:CDS:1 [Entrophospora sp. SA101]CAJ0864056.1 5919_t:CDS:1 [Entrophospora sp. SA101]